MVASVVLSIAFVFWPFLPFQGQKSSQDLIHWRSVAEGEAESLATRRPILYLFTADWCPPCVALKATVFSDRAIADLVERSFVPVEVEDILDAESRSRPEVRELKFKYLVSRLPTLVVTHAHGGPAVSQEGRPVYSEMVRFLETAPARLLEAEERYEQSRSQRR